MPLSFQDIPVGRDARINELGDASDRLHELGLTPGTIIRLVRVAPFGDPVEIEVRGARLCLRRSEARGIRVSLVE
ncbi:MAG TPA: FeoA family protein [Fimbriimonadaceae bacterium]|jgi:Fe2+ transport system protein FeoA|nr:ferrous iron transport protein A [Armatimonadota bacterium]HCM74356.1 ferrous iron transport protein A [Armatimonadota bacterium]HRD32219.1 FeoA family protein [Fimbriimonadaceae bacterium]HRE93239.1 FeoA family protein [Fimbriimonadaceae bacterium]HRI74671.1 FeoA family protein [Fimbriimonadaceae bacterium]